MRTNTATAVYDEYGTNTGTAVNGVLFGTAYGKRDEGMYVEAATPSMRIEALSTSALQVTNITIATWIYNTVRGSSYRHVAGKEGSYVLTVRDGYLTGGVRSFTQSTYLVPTNQWIHAAYTWDGATTRVYANGVQVASGAEARAITQTTNSVYIGSGVNLYAFSGYIDETAIWGRALSSNEIYTAASTPLYAPYKP
jgi:hypothetical protein